MPNLLLTYLMAEITFSTKVDIMEIKEETADMGQKSRREKWADFIYDWIKKHYLHDETQNRWCCHCLTMLQYYTMENVYMTLDDLREYMMAYLDAIGKLVVVDGEDLGILMCFSF